jgi:hypothetical protein
MPRKRQQGGFIPQLAGIVSAAQGVNRLGQQYKPATKLTQGLNALGLETDPNKLSGWRKAGASVLQGFRDFLGWGPMEGGNMIMGQSYGVPSLMTVKPVLVSQVRGSGRRKAKKGNGKKRKK